MDTIQIEITNICRRRCANCTRFVGYAQPYFMDFDQFREAVDSLADFPNMTGMMGGEPLLHPEFERFCDYALSKIPRMRLGLWTCLPEGKEHLRDVIVQTFGNIFLNDHTRGDVMHHPFLVASEEMVSDWRRNDCFFQDAWSAAINPNGAFFCEIAASLSTLFGGRGWPVVPGWWKRTDFEEQIQQWCRMCGGALKLRRRPSTDAVDDVSPGNLRRMPTSPRLRIYDGGFVEPQPLAAYKDPLYRARIADRYGLRLSLNAKCFNEPHRGRALMLEYMNGH
jgi:hypothetical protein